MATDHTTAPPQSRETTIAIVGSAIVGLVLATLVAGNPFAATKAAYTDYSNAMEAKGGAGPAPAAAPAAAPAPAVAPK
jgi:hypothetical protein